MQYVSSSLLLACDVISSSAMYLNCSSCPSNRKIVVADGTTTTVASTRDV